MIICEHQTFLIDDEAGPKRRLWSRLRCTGELVAKKAAPEIVERIVTAERTGLLPGALLALDRLRRGYVNDDWG